MESIPSITKRFYYIGNPKRADDIRKAFEEIGAYTSDLFFNLNETNIYYTIIMNGQLTVSANTTKNILYNFIVQDYTELKLSYKPQEGELCIGRFKNSLYYVIGKYHIKDNNNGGMIVTKFADKKIIMQPDYYAPLSELNNIIEYLKTKV